MGRTQEVAIDSVYFATPRGQEPPTTRAHSEENVFTASSRRLADGTSPLTRVDGRKRASVIPTEYAYSQDFATRGRGRRHDSPHVRTASAIFRFIASSVVGLTPRVR
jgi:hypothetical protein